MRPSPKSSLLLYYKESSKKMANLHKLFLFFSEKPPSHKKLYLIFKSIIPHFCEKSASFFLFFYDVSSADCLLKPC